jgi:hypothetical protein
MTGQQIIDWFLKHDNWKNALGHEELWELIPYGLDWSDEIKIKEEELNKINAADTNKFSTEKWKILCDINDSKLKEYLTNEGIGEIKQEYHYGGEGQGDEYYNVWYFPLHGVYLRIDGYYQSYDGASFENEPYEVRPQERVITVYE